MAGSPGNETAKEQRYIEFENKVHIATVIIVIMGRKCWCR